MVKKLNRGDDGEHHPPAAGVRSSIMRSSRRGRSDNGTTASTKSRSSRESSKRGSSCPASEEACSSRAMASGTSCSDLVASQPPAPDPYLAYLKKKDKFPSRRLLQNPRMPRCCQFSEDRKEPSAGRSRGATDQLGDIARAEN
jgi:hypothetical protein